MDTSSTDLITGHPRPEAYISPRGVRRASIESDPPLDKVKPDPLAGRMVRAKMDAANNSADFDILGAKVMAPRGTQDSNPRGALRREFSQRTDTNAVNPITNLPKEVPQSKEKNSKGSVALEFCQRIDTNYINPITSLPKDVPDTRRGAEDI